MYIWLLYVTYISCMVLSIPPAQAPRVKLALKAIDESGTATDRKYHMAFTLLQSMLLSLAPNHDHIVWHAITTLAWFGGLRSAEYATNSGSEPLVQHIQFGKLHSLSFMYFTVTHSKTHTHTCQVPIGCARHEVCAVCAMKTYFKIRTCAGTLYPYAPLFFYASSLVLTKSVLNSFIKKHHLTDGIGSHTIQFTFPTCWLCFNGSNSWIF